jgi:hypothetical protein
MKVSQKSIAQRDLRDAMARLVASQTDLRKTECVIEAAAAAMGVCAILIGLLPKDSHAQIVERLCDTLPEAVERRHSEIASGRFDDHMARRRH